MSIMLHNTTEPGFTLSRLFGNPDNSRVPSISWPPVAPTHPPTPAKHTHLHVLASAGNASQAADTAAADCCCNLLAGQADGADDSGQLSVNVALALLLQA